MGAVPLHVRKRAVLISRSHLPASSSDTLKSPNVVEKTKNRAGFDACQRTSCSSPSSVIGARPSPSFSALPSPSCSMRFADSRGLNAYPEHLYEQHPRLIVCSRSNSSIMEITHDPCVTPGIVLTLVHMRLSCVVLNGKRCCPREVSVHDNVPTGLFSCFFESPVDCSQSPPVPSSSKFQRKDHQGINSALQLVAEH